MKCLPKFRFPEFENDEEWEYLNGNILFEPISNKNHNSDLPILAITQEHGAIPREKIDYNVSVSEKSVESYKIVEVGDFIISLRSFQGGIEYSSYLGLCSPAYVILRKKLDVLNDFYRHYFKSFSFIQDLNRNLEGIRDGKMISYKQFSDILIPKPKKQEQQKIASCLSSLDGLIAAQNRKLDAWKEHKNGLIQNLFPQEGESVPKVRFPEFESDGEWLEMKLGKVYYFLVTNSFSRDKLNFENGEVKNIHYGDIHTKFSTLFDIGRESVPYINSEVSIEKIREECYCVEGDIIFADASEDLSDVGKSIEIVNLHGEKLVSGLHTLMARQIERKLEIGFGGYLFKSNWVRQQIQREAQGAKVLGISAGRILNIKISFPQNLKEQQKIASCLSAVDELITYQQEKITQLQQHKKGLMQGLFPKNL